MSIDDGIAMNQTQCHAPRIMLVRRGFTFLEFTVALVVLGVVLSGLFPLLAITSRELQPITIKQSDGTFTFDCRTPARDWGTKRVRILRTRISPTNATYGI